MGENVKRHIWHNSTDAMKRAVDLSRIAKENLEDLAWQLAHADVIPKTWDWDGDDWTAHLELKSAEQASKDSTIPLERFEARVQEELAAREEQLAELQAQLWELRKRIAELEVRPYYPLCPHLGPCPPMWTGTITGPYNVKGATAGEPD